MVRLLGCKLELRGWWKQLSENIELFLAREGAQCWCEVASALLAHEAKEVQEVEHTARPVDLVHPVRDVRRNVDETRELDFISQGPQMFGNLANDDTTVRVTSDGVRSVRLRPLDGNSAG